jgi:hypothetical protein
MVASLKKSIIQGAVNRRQQVENERNLLEKLSILRLGTLSLTSSLFLCKFNNFRRVHFFCSLFFQHRSHARVSNTFFIVFPNFYTKVDYKYCRNNWAMKQPFSSVCEREETRYTARNGRHTHL